ncbi:MAG: aminopeptidase P family protein [Clostridia bacterium]|nr:aminopeptidase P family protein [Clostridia bacterium]
MIKKRIATLQNILQNNQAFLIKSPSNRYYLTGFNSSAGSILITKNAAFLFIDFRYFEKAKSTVTGCEVLLLDKGDKGIFDFCNEQGIKEVFIETDFLSVGKFKNLSNLFKGIKISNDKILDTKLYEMRAVKDEYELQFIKQSQELTDKTFEYILNKIEVGKTEKEIALQMEFFMRSMGADGIAFDFIVVSGKNSSLPHGVPTNKKIESGDFVTMDFGARVNGYCSDMTRTIAIGYVSEQQKAVYDTTLKAQLAALDTIKAGVLCGDADKTARDIIYNAGYTGCFGHSLGHSVGIDIHESPNLSPNSTAVLQNGNVVTVEPGIYLENQFGVRIEDMVYVTDSGCINLTKATKELIIL